jgi:hypothetical protein
MIAAEIVGGIVVRAIIGTASWATETLGGFWVESSTPVWIGGTWSEVEGFLPPVEPTV